VSTAAAGAAFDADYRATAIPVRAWRVIVVIFQIIAIWLGAILVMPWISCSRRDRMKARFAARMLRGLGVRVRILGSLPDPRKLCVTSGAARNLECGPSPAARRRASASPCQGEAIRSAALTSLGKGLDPREPRAFVFVANHVSWLDPHLLNLVGGARFIAKREVASYPVFGMIVRQFGAIFIHRGCIRDAYRVKSEAAASLLNGEHVAFFPEGTTSSGERINYFYPALFQAAIDAGAAVQPIAIRWHHADGRLNLDAAFLGDMTLVESIALMLKHRVIYAEVTLCEMIEAAGLSRRELAYRTRAAIAEKLKLEPFASRPRRTPWEDYAGDRPRDAESGSSRTVVTAG
jgi:1-acyl-sn-glycerol-3-phosphate acyltransferase